MKSRWDITEEAFVLLRGQVRKPAMSPEDQDGCQCSFFKCVDRRLFYCAVAVTSAVQMFSMI